MMTSQPVFRILVADDEHQMLESYQTVLRDCDEPSRASLAVSSLESELYGTKGRAESTAGRIELTLCTQGEQAIQETERALRQGRPYAVALLDVRMPPGINGVQAAKAIRDLDPDLHIVVVTGHSDVDPREIVSSITPPERLFYLVKPFQPQELQQLVSALTHKWSAERQLIEAHRQLKEQYGELEAALTEAQEAKKRAELANHSKTEFLANMSHELRTPFNAIIGFADMMVRETYGPLGNERYGQYVRHINDSASHLLELINDILDVSRIENESLRLDEAPVALHQVLRSCVEMVRVRAAKSLVGIDMEVDQDLTLMGDERRIKQTVINVLANAVKFSRTGTRIRVAAYRDFDGSVVVEVSDSGIGIPDEQLARVVLPFVQVDSALSRKHDGAGLGLTLAKAFTELHQGSLKIDSILDRGTTVTLCYPASRSVASN
jgi:two-component system, cell cycle sensor histidine kinase PleC